jgi:uncharacterized membrane protein YtjA (UPF0391 family)
MILRACRRARKPPSAARWNAAQRAAFSPAIDNIADEETNMLKWALIFAVVALLAGALGFGGVAGAAAGIAKLLFFIFVVGFVIFLVLGLVAGRRVMR